MTFLNTLAAIAALNLAHVVAAPPDVAADIVSTFYLGGYDINGVILPSPSLTLESDGVPHMAIEFVSPFHKPAHCLVAEVYNVGGNSRTLVRPDVAGDDDVPGVFPLAADGIAKVQVLMASNAELQEYKDAGATRWVTGTTTFVAACKADDDTDASGASMKFSQFYQATLGTSTSPT